MTGHVIKYPLIMLVGGDEENQNFDRKDNEEHCS